MTDPTFDDPFAGLETVEDAGWPDDDPAGDLGSDDEGTGDLPDDADDGEQAGGADDDFVHLHTHLETSMLDGASRIPDAVKAAAALGQKAMAITDHGRLGGTWKFVQECEKAGIKPILGMEAYVAIGSRFEKNEIKVPQDDPTVEGEKTKRYEHLTLLAATKQGWRNLVAMHNASHESYWYYPRIDYDLMRQHSEGIIVLTGCLAGPVLGPVARWVAGQEAREQAAEEAEKLKASVDAARQRLVPLVAEARRIVTEHAGVDLPRMRPEELMKAALGQLPDTAPEAIARLQEIELEVDAYVELRDEYRGLLHAASDHELDTARENLARLVDIFGAENVYVEVMEHGIEFESRALPVVIELAEEFGLKCVATNDSHYTYEHDAEAHDAWLALQAGTGDKARIDNRDRFRFNGEGYFIRSGEQMRALRPEPWWVEAVNTSAEVAARVEDDVLPERYMRLPSYPCPPGFDSTADYFKHLVKQGAVRRWGENPSREVKDRLRYEVRTIVGMGLHDYFLIVQDVINWARSDYTAADWIARENGEHVDDEARERKKPILVGPGRGSAAGSAVSYALGIVGLDPVRFDLIFERFLDPTRVGMPDIDVDFERDRRAEVLQFLVERWGRDKVAHIGAFSTAKTRAAIKSAARVLGVSPALQNKLTKAVPLIDGKFPSVEVLTDTRRSEGSVLRDVLAEVDDRSGTADADRPLSQRIMTLAAAFENLTSGEGVHACGMLLADEPMTEMVPLRLDHKKDASPDAPAIALWDGKDVDSFGLLKLDVLGLRTLDLISASLEEASRLEGRPITVDDIPDGDDHDSPGVAEAWRLLQEGNTAGVFQLESSGMTELTENVSPNSLEDLSALVALYRPGPLTAGMHTHYADRKNGREPVDYGLFTNDPDEAEIIKDVLGPTYGLNVYQEQSMLLGQRVAGFGAALTNRLRKAISKKNEAEFPELGRLFIEGAMRDHTEDGEPKLAFAESTAEALWDSIKGSAAYAFNKAHSAAYGYVGYMTAWIKANYPSAFGAGLLSVTKAADKRHATLASLAAQGIEVLPPDINRSMASTSALDERTVIIGLGEIKGVGSAVAEQIVAERERGGPFASAGDIMARVPDVQTNELAVLAEAGALDAFGTRLGQVTVARALRNRPETEVPDSEWDVLERWVRQHLLLGVAVGDYPLADPDIQQQVRDHQRVQDEYGMFGDSARVPLHRVPDYLGDDQWATTKTLGLISAWNPRAVSNGTMVNLVLENSRSRFDAVAWPRTMDAIKGEDVGLGSIVEAVVRSRVREIHAENDDGEVEVTTKTELEVQAFIPVVIEQSSRPPTVDPLSIPLLELCSGTLDGPAREVVAEVVEPADADEPQGVRVGPVQVEVAGSGPDALDLALSVSQHVPSLSTLPFNLLRPHVKSVDLANLRRAACETGVYRLAGQWGQMWLRVLDADDVDLHAPWPVPYHLADDPTAWAASQPFGNVRRLDDAVAAPLLEAQGVLDVAA